MYRYVKWIHEVDTTCVHEVGGKGAHLGALTKAGFRVPEGFCILAHAYDRFFETNHLDELSHKVLKPFYLSDLSGLEQRTVQFQDVFIQAPVPGDIVEEICGLYQVLSQDIGQGPARVAVRSSVASKDLTRTSFPGQMDTFHNVAGDEQLISYVKKCWASLWNFSALVQRLSPGIDPYGVLIAPVVQRMVPAESAGVLFTANPVDPRKHEMVIDACLGLGEGVVSGRFEVDHFVLQKDPLKIVRQEIGVKDKKIVMSEDSTRGTEILPVSGEEVRTPCLSWAQIKELVQVGREVERHFGKPQDIEWAYADNILYLLQTRSITGLAAVPSPHEMTIEHEEWVSESDTPIDPNYPIYTAANISEVLPGVLTPLTQTGLEVLEYGFQAANLALGIISKEDIKGRRFFFLGSFYGRAFLNLSVVRQITARVPGGTSAEVDRDTPQEFLKPAQRGAQTVTLGYVLFLMRVMRNSWNRLHRIPGEAYSCRAHVDQRITEGRRSMDRSTRPWEEYLQLLEDGWEDGYQVMRIHIEISQFAVVFYEMLRKLITRWLKDDKEAMASRLVTGLATVESAEPVAEIWELSRMVKASPELNAIFETPDPVEIRDRLEASDTDEVRRFKEALGRFLAKYGYRSIFEAEVMLPSWEEDPGFVFTMIRNYLSQREDHNPQSVQKRQEKVREQAVQDALRRLPVHKRKIFQWALAHTQHFISLREFMKATLMMGVGHTKIIFRELSRSFHEQGITEEPNDFYFLVREEILDILRGGASKGSLKEKIARRKNEYEKNKQVTLPEYFEGRPKPISRKDSAYHSEGIKVLRGIPLSPGRVRGRARVIRDPRGAALMEPGEILVAPVTDAGWTPLFLTAAGLVVDVGGLLSHGSIVAREYGIPGVINVKIATEVIKNGQEIIVDGDRGEVIIVTIESRVDFPLPCNSPYSK